MNKNNFLLFLVLIVFVSCDNNIHRIIEHQDEIIEYSRSKEIINSKERNFYMLITYDSDNHLLNEYVFDKVVEEGKTFYTLFRDDIQLTPDPVIGIDKESDNYQEEICDYYQKASCFLVSYGIINLSGRTYENSSKVTVFLENGGTLIYRPKSYLGDRESVYFEKVKGDWYLMK